MSVSPGEIVEGRKPHTPLSRRRFLGTATASLGAIVLAGCGGGEEDAASGTMTAQGWRGRRTKSDTAAPSAPQGLSAAAASSSSIVLNWGAATDNVGVTGYQIYRCSGGGCAPSVQIANPKSTSYTDSGLNPATSYSYCVVAVDSAGNVSARSAIAAASTLPAATPAADTTPPAVPTGVTASATSSSSITVNWGAASDNVGVTGYLLYRCSGGGCTSVTQIAKQTATSYTDAGLTAGTSYSYSVAAVDAAGNVSAPSRLATAVTLSATSTVTWSVNPQPVLIAGSSSGFDLSQTLPQGVARGGTFSLDASSAPLPNGVTLSPAGILSASASTTGTFSGVIFAYQEPTA